MATRNTVSKLKTETTVPAEASIQPASFNGINFRKTNLYRNNDAHAKVIDFAKGKAVKVEADENGIQSIDVNGYTVRIYGEKPSLDTDDFVDLV